MARAKTHWVAAAAAMAASAILSAPASADPECRSAVSEACFTAHGYLLTTNGTPSFRIFTANNRVLGIEGGESPPLPDVVRKVLAPDMFSNRLDGDFKVCPRTPAREGTMQMVCVSDASNLKLEAR